MAINKVEFGGNTLIDLSGDTLSNANQIVQGVVGHLRDGTQVTGTYQGGGTDGYTLTNIVPSQTITATTTVENAYMASIPTYTDVLELGEAYLVTYDNDEYVLWCYEGWSQEYLIGDNQIVDSTYIGRLISPFTIDYGVVVDELIFISRDTTAHTIKVDKITFIDPTATLISKTITQNGTYNASSDNADGFSSVTVNVSSSGPKVETGTITISSNTRFIAFIHSLGTVPKVCSILHDDIDTVPSDSRYIGAVGAYTGVDMLYLTSSAYTTNGVLSVMMNQDSSGKVTRQAPSSASYGATTWSNTKVEFVSGSTSTRWKLGTYTYIVVA